MRGRFRRCGHDFLGIDLLIPAVLTVLKKESVHGYLLIERLSKMGLNLSSLHPSIVYRILRDMEMQGLVVSNWDLQATGPARRIYSITETGKSLLKQWALVAKQNIEMVQKLINLIEGGE